ncbi:MAG: GPW/gp25 family protein [Deltaproteobacteria bacterium]|nr:GPW/gp25 family protein [Deltaproteobacteria bacterium]
MLRRDYCFPFRIDGASRQGAATPYATHVEQMIRQVLLTSPGERACLPEFGCGLRQLLFAPNSESLTATTRIVVKQALDRWLAGQIELRTVEVLEPEGEHECSVRLRIEYVLVETRQSRTMEVQVLG